MENKMKFEEAILLLENKIAALESGALGLDEAISVYEEAIGLIRICNDRLEAAEQKVRLLTEASDGAVTDAPFGDINED
nr:exodeoxyribonuclease VII small subunit [Clostridia bacterium]